MYEASYADYLVEPEETRVICGIPRHKSSLAPVALELETGLSGLRTQPGMYAYATVNAEWSKNPKRVDRPTSPPVAYAVPSVDDLVRRWTNIRNNDASVEPEAASSSNGQLIIG